MVVESRPPDTTATARRSAITVLLESGTIGRLSPNNADPGAAWTSQVTVMLSYNLLIYLLD